LKIFKKISKFIMHTVVWFYKVMLDELTIDCSSNLSNAIMLLLDLRVGAGAPVPLIDVVDTTSGRQGRLINRGTRRGPGTIIKSSRYNHVAVGRMDTREKRNSPRVPLVSKGVAVLGEVKVDCRTRDISAGGYGIEIPNDHLPGWTHRSRSG
jgi:hypothetical protein